MMKPCAMVAGLSVLAVWAGCIDPVAAQYDRDGRYVPSPNGVPRDPSAQPIPMYPGTPGAAIGTPTLPRPPAPAAPLPRLPEPNVGPFSTRPGRLNRVQCAREWSAHTGLTRRDFEQRCRKN